MNRRDFVSRVSLGAAAACTGFGKPALAAPASGQLNVRFIGMMAFVERRDRSFLVATPGDGHHVQTTHVPFLMARAGSPIAKALNMTAVEGVIPEAFDTALIGTRPSDFVYRSLANTALEFISGKGDAVSNSADEMAQLHAIAPGKRVRGNLEKWALATVSLRGGRLENSSAHPDAGKVWSFGAYRQRLTDAVNYRTHPNASTTLRLTSGTDASTVTFAPGEATELWVISAADFGDRMNDPTRLIHGELLFDYLVDATPLVAECADATGRDVPMSKLPFVKPTTASMGIIAGEATMPPLSDLCWMACILLNTSTGKY